MLTVRTKDQDGKTYARFEPAYEPQPVSAETEEKKDEAAPAEEKKEDAAKAKKTPEEVRQEVNDLSARLSPWTFVIPAYNRTSFAKKMSELVKDKAPPAAPAGDGATPTEPGDGEGEDASMFPNDLPPEIQQQIKALQKSGPPREGGQKPDEAPVTPATPPVGEKPKEPHESGPEPTPPPKPPEEPKPPQ